MIKVAQQWTEQEFAHSTLRTSALTREPKIGGTTCRQTDGQHSASVLYVKRDLHCLSRSAQFGPCLGEHPGTTPGARVCGVVVALRRGRRQLAALGLVVRQRPRHSRVFIRHHARD